MELDIEMTIQPPNNSPEPTPVTPVCSRFGFPVDGSLRQRSSDFGLNMTSIFDEAWRGVLALIWLVCALLVWFLLMRILDPIYWGYFDPLCAVVVWITTFRLAISGIRNGNIASRICGALALLVIIAPIPFIIVAGYQLSKH